ncbi:plasmid recombination protein [Phytohalomonas tamaricis]|uniref:plasmid recombination protein n=1 Tax=Phytohalomonas tamaricis TaxID=2081032 RepID=UPI000D0AC170|nr:plasmid recombination protein [Phytohalomonas tamaricis]
MSKPTGYQFIRIQGFPRGPASKRHTVGSILAEGLRQPGHISHIPGKPHYELERLDSPLEVVEELPAWLNEQMKIARNKSKRSDGTEYFRSVRKDALAIGTVIASLPESMSEFNPERYKSFSECTTEWFKDFLSPYEMLIHFRLNHFDEEHPHFHLWFTPQPNEKREFNWSLTSVCAQGRQFYHDLQKRFFSEVGYQFFEERAKPFEDRKPRTSRWHAVKQRDAINLSTRP